MAVVIDKVLTLAYAVLTPHRCRFCGTAMLDCGNPYLCMRCLAVMPWIGGDACKKCGYPAGPYVGGREDCVRCRGGRIRLNGAAAVVRYRGGARSLVKSLKFRSETGLVKPVAGLMAERLRKADFFGGIDAVIPVALHERRRRRRGFDQALLLAEGVTEATGLSLRPHALMRIRETPSQAMLRRKERLVNVQGAFAVRESLKGAGVLLIDDVMTTGATMTECARACREAGARKVFALIFAR